MNINNTKLFAVIGAGFIGKALIRNLLQKGVSVSVLDHNPCPPEFANKLTWVVGDFHNQYLLSIVLQDAFVAYHFVSSTVPGDQHIDYAVELNENVVSTLHFIDACVSGGIGRVVFSSSASVYGVQNKVPIDELALTNPISTHGIQKLMIEKFLLFAKYLHGIDVRILRIANPYGAGQNVSGRQGFIAMVIGNILNGNPVILRDHGRVVRDFIYIDDLAEFLALSGMLENFPSVVNVGSGIGCALNDVIKLMEELIGKPISIATTDSRVVDIPVSVLNVALISSTTSYTPVTCLRNGLKKILQHHGFNITALKNEENV